MYVYDTVDERVIFEDADVSLVFSLLHRSSLTKSVLNFLPDMTYRKKFMA